MNKPISAKDVAPPKVTTGPLAGSRKSIPRRKAMTMCECRSARSRSTEGASFQVYDTSGPYTDADATIDVRRGLPPLRAAMDRSAGRQIR